MMGREPGGEREGRLRRERTYKRRNQEKVRPTEETKEARESICVCVGVCVCEECVRAHDCVNVCVRAGVSPCVLQCSDERPQLSASPTSSITTPSLALSLSLLPSPCSLHLCFHLYLPEVGKPGY